MDDIFCCPSSACNFYNSLSARNVFPLLKFCSLPFQGCLSATAVGTDSVSVGWLQDDATRAGANHKFPSFRSPHFSAREERTDVPLRKSRCPAEPQCPVYWDSDQVHQRKLSRVWKQFSLLFFLFAFASSIFFIACGIL